MYTIKLDGKILYSPAMPGKTYKVMNPQLSLDIETNGNCSFVIPPGNHLHDAVRRRKSIVTVHQDGQEIFRGRVLDDETDQYNQKSVYCEGVRSYLNDSQAAPYQYTGTPRGLFEKLIGEHNAQIEEEKQFVIGDVTISRAEEALTCECTAYWETFKEIEEKLLNAYGGYLRARIRGGTQYIDWVQEYGGTNDQEIRFAVNLIDIKDKNDSADIFTILRPLGASEMGDDGEFAEAVNIASVNGGLDYIQDDEAIEKYGRIWRTYTWPNEENPARLLEKAREYLKIGAELRTITLQAIDMHFLSGSAQAIRVGDKVRIVSDPHGIDLEKVCCKIDIDLANPEKTTYTFGEPLKALTDNTVKAEKELETLTGYGGGGRSIKKENNGIIRWAQAQVNAANANILLTTGEVNSLKNTMSQAWIEIDGLAAAIQMKASLEEVNDLGMRMTGAEININGLDAQILLKASKTEVDDLGERVSSAEIEIDGINSEITLKADKIDLQGYVTANQLATEFSNFESGISDDLYVSALSANAFECSSFSMGSYGMSLKRTDYVKSVGRTQRHVMSPAGVTVDIWEISSISNGELYYMSWE